MQPCSTDPPIQHSHPDLPGPSMKMMLTKLKFLETKRYMLPAVFSCIGAAVVSPELLFLLNSSEDNVTLLLPFCLAAFETHSVHPGS